MSVYAFGPFILDTAGRRLTRDGQRMAVPGKAWQILLMLAEAGGRLVSHDTFRARLWPNVVVEDRTLTVHMSTLRKALGDGSASLIETVSREGYRLAAPVDQWWAGAAPGSGDSTSLGEQVRHHIVPGTHFSVMQSPGIELIAKRLIDLPNGALEAIRERTWV